MNTSHKSTLYIILNYSFNENIFKLISSLEKFLFSFISVSLQYDFKLYITYNNFYSLLFPSKLKDPTYFLTSNYSGMHESIQEALNKFLSSITDLDDKLVQAEQNNESNEISYPINVILKKILLEVNNKKASNTSNSPGGFFLGVGIGNTFNDKIILINDSEEDFDNINQKYIFLLKQKEVKIDILSLNKNNKNEISKAITFFTKGIFDCISDKKNNIEQMLLFEYMPLKFTKKLPKLNMDIKYTFSYNQAISDQNLECSVCHKEMVNTRNIYGQNDEIGEDINMDDKKKNEKHSLHYIEKEKNIFCNNCYYKLKNKK